MLSLSLGACTSYSSRKPALYYESVMIKSSPPRADERTQLLKLLPGKLKNRRVLVKRKGRKQTVYGPKKQNLKKLSYSELKALWLSLDQRYFGAEIDLKMMTLNKDSIPVTVWIDLRGNMTIESGQWKVSHVPRGPKEVEERWHIGPLKVKAGAKWSKRALRSINVALSKLSPEELKLMRGIPFIRKKKGRSSSQAALYIQEGDCDAIIQIFNLAIKSERYTFSGEAKAALPATVTPLLHEFGHALHFYPYRHALCRSRQMVKAYNQKVTRANRATGKKRRRLNHELKLENKAINRINRKIDQLKGGAGICGSARGPRMVRLMRNDEWWI